MSGNQSGASEAGRTLRGVARTSVTWTVGLLVAAFVASRTEALRRTGDILPTGPTEVLELASAGGGLATVGLASGALVGGIVLCARPRPDDPSPLATFRARRMLIMCVPLLLHWTATVVSYDPDARKPLGEVLLVLFLSGSLLLMPLYLVEQALRWGEETSSRMVAPLMALLGGGLLGAALVMAAAAMDHTSHKRMATSFLWGSPTWAPGLWGAVIALGAMHATAVSIWAAAGQQWALGRPTRPRSSAARLALPLTLCALGVLVLGPEVLPRPE